jgi:hypothetical protein
MILKISIAFFFLFLLFGCSKPVNQCTIYLNENKQQNFTICVNSIYHGYIQMDDYTGETKNYFENYEIIERESLASKKIENDYDVYYLKEKSTSKFRYLVRYIIGNKEYNVSFLLSNYMFDNLKNAKYNFNESIDYVSQFEGKKCFPPPNFFRFKEMK